MPGLRWLLSSKKKQNIDSELVFLIKPEIVTPIAPSMRGKVWWKAGAGNELVAPSESCPSGPGT